LTVPEINVVCHTEVLTAELSVLECGAYQIKTDMARLITCMSSGVQIPAEVIQLADEAMHSKIHKFISSVWNKK